MDADQFARDAVGLHSRLSRATFAMCGQRALAEESAQEALLRAWARVDDGEELRSLEAWTMRVALNWCKSQLRRVDAESRAMGRLPPAPRLDHDSTAALSDEVRLAVLALPPRQREVVVLHYLSDMDLASIAEVTGRSEGAIKNALFHGRTTLAAELGHARDDLEASP